MGTAEEEIARIEAEILKTKYNKATQHHIGKLKAKIARLREDIILRQSKAGGGGHAYAVKRSGHASAGLIGLPSSGKSTLLNSLTNAKSEVAAYAFTTLTIVPGLLEHKGAKIQVLDMPGIIEGAAKGKGRGREVLSVARGLDLILLIMDVENVHLNVLLSELRKVGIRVNESKPEVVVRPTMSGGVSVAYTGPHRKMTVEEAEDIVRSYGLVNADVVIREDVNEERLIDALAGNRTYSKGMVIITKTDLCERKKLANLKRELKAWSPVFVSAKSRTGLEEVRDAIFLKLDFMRIYLRPPGKKADMDEPLIVKKGSTVDEVCKVLHRDLSRKFRHAFVTGPSAKHPAQTVSRDHRLRDGDVLTIVAEK